MTILIYSEKKVVSQLLVGYIERYFENINYSHNMSIMQINELIKLKSLIEEVEDEYLLIAESGYNDMSFLEMVSHRENVLLIISSKEQKNIKEKYQNFITCDSLHKLESYLDNILKINNNSSIKLLTSREKEILKLIAKGLLNKEIANELNITERTVKNHISNIFKKINVYDRTQAAVFAIKNKIFLL